jgi:dihydroorotate dehydrogenase (fumarate)
MPPVHQRNADADAFFSSTESHGITLPESRQIRWHVPCDELFAGPDMASLTTSYLTLQLEHPFISGASPLADRTDTARRLEDGGASAIVLRSLFEEQITMASHGRIAGMDPLEPAFAPLLGNFPAAESYALQPDEYLAQIDRLKTALQIPVIASLNGMRTAEWLTFATRIERAGADALELNMYQLVADPRRSSLSVESDIRDMVATFKRTLRIPIAVKLPLFVTAPVHFACELDAAGADGLIIFNRLYAPTIDIETMTAEPRLQLSTSSELVPRLAWLPLLRGHVRGSLALTGGVETPEDAIRAILAGADVVQLVSAVLRDGPGCFTVFKKDVARWLDAKGFTSIGEARGRLATAPGIGAELAARAAYLRTLQSGPTAWTTAERKEG